MITLFRRLWPVLVAVIACLVIFYQFDWNNMLVLLPTLPVGWLLLTMSVGALLVFAICAMRWIAISQLSWRPLVMFRVHCYVSLSIVASLVTPFQLGELVKIRFAKEAGLKVGNSAVNVVLERILDLSTIAAMGCAGFVYLRTGLAVVSLFVMFALFLAGVTIPLVLEAWLKKFGDTQFGNIARSFAGPTLPFRSLFVVAVMTLLKWGLTLATWMFILELVGVNLTVSQGSFLVGAVTAIAIISMIPGGLGVQELSVRAILIGMGIEPIHAETAAIVLRLFTPVMVLVGLAHLPFLYKALRRTEGKSLHV
jgi:uncharacterized membrane protein YbhN (UPF0104 family)